MRINKTQLTTADRKLTDRVRRKFREGIRTDHLIAPGDHVLVGLSGGKDSMAFLQLLGEYRRHAARPVSSVRGRAERPSSPWPNNSVASASPSVTTATTSSLQP